MIAGIDSFKQNLAGNIITSSSDMIDPITLPNLVTFIDGSVPLGLDVVQPADATAITGGNALVERKFMTETFTGATFFYKRVWTNNNRPALTANSGPRDLDSSAPSNAKYNFIKTRNSPRTCFAKFKITSATDRVGLYFWGTGSTGDHRVFYLVGNQLLMQYQTVRGSSLSWRKQWDLGSILGKWITIAVSADATLSTSNWKCYLDGRLLTSILTVEDTLTGTFGAGAQMFASITSATTQTNGLAAMCLYDTELNAETIQKVTNFINAKY